MHIKCKNFFPNRLTQQRINFGLTFNSLNNQNMRNYDELSHKIVIKSERLRVKKPDFEINNNKNAIRVLL